MTNFVPLTPPIHNSHLKLVLLCPISSKFKRINTFCTLSLINQTQHKAININENFWAISTLESKKKLYITCLQFSYSLALQFPCDVIYLPDGCEANAITFVLPSNNHLNVHSDIKASENNRSYSKTGNFYLIQTLNISNFCNHNLWAIATKIPEMKDSSIFSISSTLTKLRSFPTKHWSAHIFQILHTILTSLTIVMVLISFITICCKCWWNKYGCVPKYTRPQHPSTSNDINLATTSTSDNSKPSQVTPQIIQEILKSYDINLEKFKHYRQHL